MSILDILVPVAETRVSTNPLAPRRRRLEGLRIGWLDNLKANAAGLLRGIEADLRRQGCAFEAVHATKNATAPAPDNVMAHLQTCDAVVLAIAD